MPMSFEKCYRKMRLIFLKSVRFLKTRLKCQTQYVPEIAYSLICQFFIALIAASLLLGLNQRLNPPQNIVTVDVLKLSKAHLQKTLGLHPEANSEEFIKKYVAMLEQLLKEKSRQQTLIILPKEAVINGAIDITENIQEKLEALYEH